MQVPVVVRESLLEAILNAIRKGHYVVCICPERSGLSTVLQQMSYHVPENEDTHYCLLDVGKLGVSSRKQMCKSFGPYLSKSKPSLSAYLPSRGSIINCLIHLAIKAPFSTIIAVDNFHKLPITTQKEFISTTRNFYTDRYNEPLYQKVLFVIGGAIDLYKCEPKETSPYNIAERIYPGEFDFSPQEVRDYLTRRLPPENLYVDEIAQNYVYTLTSGQIYVIEKLCDKLIKKLKKDRLTEVTMDEVNLAVSSMLDDMDSYFSVLLDNIRNLEQDVKLFLIEVLAGKLHKFSRYNSYIQQLELLGLLKEERHFARIRSPLLELYLRDTGLGMSPPVVPKELAVPMVLGGNVKAYENLFELENGLRNFITSQLYAKYGAKWGDHIPTSNGWNRAGDRHNAYKNDVWIGEPSYPLIAFSFFSNLKELISYNWDIFGNQFRPQRKFLGYFDRLEEIRNDIAHSRLLSHRQLRELENIRDAFRSSMMAK